MDRRLIYVPDTLEYIEINEGDGSNLWESDIADGYVDYFICEAHKVDINVYGELALIVRDSAQVLLEQPYDEYTGAEIVEKALDMLGYSPTDIEYEIIPFLY